MNLDGAVTAASAIEDPWVRNRTLAGLANSYWEAEQYQKANEVGRLVEDIPGRRCRLTGDQARGYARIPGTRGDADVAISHGKDEAHPTALTRWVGWTDDGGVEHEPERPTLRRTQRW